MNDDHVFWTLAQAGSFAEAGRRLGVARSTVLRRVRSLEAALGVALLVPSSSRLLLTNAGRVYAEGLGPALADLAALRERVLGAQSGPQARLHVRIPHFALHDALLEPLVDFHAHHPQIRLRVSVGPLRIDRSAEAFDVGFQPGLAHNHDLKAHVLFHHPVVLVGGAGLFDQMPPPASVAELGRFRRIATRDEALEALAPPEVQGAPDVEVDSYLVALALLRANQGIARMPLVLATPGLRCGGLRRVLPELDLQLPVCLVFHPKPTLAVRRYVDFMRAWVQSAGLGTP